MKYKITIYLKSGVTIEFICKEFKITWSNATGEYLSYSIEGLEKYKNVNLKISEIAAYTSEEQTHE